MSSPITWSRIRWHLYRSPIARAVKAARRMAIPGHLNRRRALLSELPRNAAIDECAAALETDGHCSVSKLVDPVLRASLSEAAQAKLRRAHDEMSVRQQANAKDFWVRLLDEDMQSGRLPLDNPFVAIALQPELVSVVANAMGEVPRLDYVLLTLSRSTDKQLSYSQLWHRDHDDTKVIKLFFYLTDVASPGDGPFTFIPGPESDLLGFRLKSHLSDEQIARWIPKSAVTAIYAPRLEAFMVNTSRCLHMGSRVSPSHERLLYTATYFSTPRLYPEPPPRFLLGGNETPLLCTLLTADR
ncbi:MAG: hypothetical protein WCI59_05415 [Betaproteobacteria bacterium]